MNKPFQFDEHFQTHYLAHYLRDPRFFGQVHKDVSPTLFSSEAAQRVVRLIQSFAVETHAPPGELIYGELDKLAKLAGLSPEDQAVQRVYIDKLLSLELRNGSYLLSEHRKFTRYQLLMDSIPIIMEAMKEGDIDAAEAALNRLSRDTSTFNDMGDFFSDDPSLRIARRLQEVGERFYLGIPEIDNTVQGLKRRQIGVFLSQRSSAGKSAALIHLCKFFVMCGKNVLAITLEDTKEDFEDKLDMCVSGVCTDELDDAERIRAAMRRWFLKGGRLHIAEFPPSKVSQLRNYAEFLKQTYGFQPDAIILDYADICEPEESALKLNSYAAGDEIYKSLASWAKDENVVIWTASQSGRAAMEAVVADQQHTAGSIAKMYHAHLVISINRTSEQQAEGLTDLHVVKNKNGQARFTRTIHSDFDRMHFRITPRND